MKEKQSNEDKWEALIKEISERAKHRDIEFVKFTNAVIDRLECERKIYNEVFARCTGKKKGA